MKKLVLLSACALTLSLASNAQLGGLLKTVSKKDSSGSLNKIISKPSTSSLTESEVISGLKEALNKGTNTASQKLSAVDGFFKDAAIKILMPEEAKKVESKLRAVGMGKQVDEAILSMNRAAELAAKEVAPIFLDAIKGMSFADAMSILRGGDNAATNYLRSKTVASLTEKFRPIIESALQKTGATKHWTTLFTAYNRFSTDKVNTDLPAYVTEKALVGVFHGVAQEESKIRKDPAARTSEILKKVFGS